MLTNKEWRLLQLLYRATDFQTSQLLAEQLGLSERTVRTYLKQLESLLPQYGAKLTYKYGQGVRLTIQWSETFQDFYNQGKEINHPIHLNDSQERQRYLLNQLFFEDQVIQVAELQESFYISKSSMAQLLGQVRHQLAAYELTLERLAPSTYQVSGEERKKRQFIADYFLADAFQEVLRSESNTSSLLEALDLSVLTEVILQECRKGQVSLSDFTLTNLVLHLGLSILRQRSGHILSDFPLEDRVIESLEYEVAARILKGLEEKLDLTFPAGETQYLALHLLTKFHQRQGVKEAQPAHKNAIVAILQDLDKQLGSKLAQDYRLLEGLTTHLNPLLLRLQYGIRLENPLLEDILRDYGWLFEVTKRSFASLECFASYEISDDEWAYMTLHVIGALDRQASQKKLKVLVVCATGLGSAQVLRYRLESQFGQRLSIVACISYHELSDSYLSGIDLLISSVDLGQLIFRVPVVVVSVFLRPEDKALLNETIDALTLGQVDGGQTWSNKELDQDLLASFEASCSEGQFLVIAEPQTKEGLLKTMLACLDDVRSEQDLQEFYHQVCLREQLSSTAFSDSMAFPHLMESLGQRGQVVVAVLRDHLFWDEAHPAIRLVFLLSPSRYRNQDLKRISHILARWVDREDFVQDLLAQPTYQNFKQLILNTSSKEES
ncbi:BglG family transcription antiterminator [Streptococcus ovuberis]|uniref:PRD domain-containing protein n=1 Tax=Streptococcus ovuberis TaxID=1936207 RepID=A0A7X6MYK9_9STRE|nr:PRD domain-containing protein [Streptococcus ovuberis]NKZ20760.1 PRD domain-containing protein [Streptococcus ovuberis]